MSTKQQKYERFMKWFKDNGGYCKSINFPTLFLPGNYVGLSAQKEIQPNDVILGVPKHLTIGASIAKNSQLKQIIAKYQILRDPQDDDTDYNVICLFLIMQNMKGENSFYYPYLQLLDSSETVMNWQDDQINRINDPYINLQFINGIRRQFQPIYSAFKEITEKNPSIFPFPLSKLIFDEHYAIVMTRGFGWGLPETMLVPFADFLNHSSSGVNHYVFDNNLQSSPDKQYIKKKFQLGLSIFPFIQNQQLLPIDYEMNAREKYIYDNREKLQNMSIAYDFKTIRLDPNITNPVYNSLIEDIIENDFQSLIYISSDSEDNDSDGDGEGLSDGDSEDTEMKKKDIYKTKDQKQQEHTLIITDQLVQKKCEHQVNIENNFVQNGWSNTNSIAEQTDKLSGIGQTNKIGKITQRENKQSLIKIQTKKCAIIMQKKYLRYVYSIVQKQIGDRYTEPKPNINSEFQEGVKFDWWWQSHQHSSQNNIQKLQNITQKTEVNQVAKLINNNYSDITVISSIKKSEQLKYFIVASSKRIYPNEQIYNCYGRRSNRFLLIWYGFSFFNNKYDSVPFRIWSEEVQKRTGHLIWSKYVTQNQYLNGVPIGNQRFNVIMLSDQFRLKQKTISYKLLAFIRYKYLRGHLVYRDYYRKNEMLVNGIVAVEMEVEVFLTYQRYLNQLACVFGLEKAGNLLQDYSSTEQMQTCEVNKQIENPARNYFKKVLQQSNWDILTRNILAVKQVIKTLLKIKDLLQTQQDQIKTGKSQPKTNILFVQIQKKTLTSLYRNSFEDLLTRQVNVLNLYGDRQKLVRQLKLMVRDYFRLLSMSSVCLTLETQFK